MFRVTRSTVKFDHIADYQESIKADVLPAMKKAGVKYYTTTRIRYGGPANVFVSAQGIDNWADLDKPSPMARAMGAEEARKSPGPARSVPVGGRDPGGAAPAGAELHRSGAVSGEPRGKRRTQLRLRPNTLADQVVFSAHTL